MSQSSLTANHISGSIVHRRSIVSFCALGHKFNRESHVMEEIRGFLLPGIGVAAQ